jgi:branched-chain amino acid transport system ATP-binding protein
VATSSKSSPTPDGEPVLTMSGIRKHYGGITAVDGVDLTLAPGEILGLIGHNGAGKTTLLDCISGFVEVDAGEVHVLGTDVTAMAPEQRARVGLGRSFQEAMLYPTLTVAETIAVARERHLTSRGVLADGLALPASYERELDVSNHVTDVLDVLGLGPFRETLTGELSTGTRRVVELGCLLAQDPDVLLLDEPSSGVAQKETEALGDLLRRVREQVGCSMLVIEHDMPLLSSLCDRMVALELGAVICTGTPAEVLSHPQVISSYLGSEPAAVSRSGRRPRAPKKIFGKARTVRA